MARNEVGGDACVSTSPPPTEKHEHRVVGAEPRAFEPARQRGLPAVVVHARGQLADVVGRRVRLEAAELAEVVDRVAGMAGGSADAEHEETSASVSRPRQTGRDAVDRVG